MGKGKERGRSKATPCQQQLFSGGVSGGRGVYVLPDRWTEPEDRLGQPQ